MLDKHRPHLASITGFRGKNLGPLKGFSSLFLVMVSPPTHVLPTLTRLKQLFSRRHLSLVAAAVLAISIGTQWPASAGSRTAHVGVANTQFQLTIGTPDPTETSAYAPPAANALSGYAESYVTNFAGTSLPAGWDVFTGIPGGDPGGHFGASHVVVGNGMLSLNTFRDPAWNNSWVTGGVCQCGVSKKYAAYFVRSRVTGAGPTEVELLWPTGNQWPPEIDFNETGGSITSTTSSVHFGATNHIVPRRVVINMTLWHTWGVIWTPTEVIYTVDGRIWGEFTNTQDISSAPMTLDLEQRQECEENRQCPTSPESMQINWVAEYSK